MPDRGTRRGTDVLKALVLGARCVFAGRPFHYAASVGEGAAMGLAIAFLKAETLRNMA